MTSLYWSARSGVFAMCTTDATSESIEERVWSDEVDAEPDVEGAAPAPERGWRAALLEDGCIVDDDDDDADALGPAVWTG